MAKSTVAAVAAPSSIDTAVSNTKAAAASGWASAKSAASHPNTIQAAKAVGIVVGVGVAYGVAAAIATKTYELLAA